MTRSSRWMDDGRTVGNDHAVVEHGDAIGNAGDEVHVVLDQQHGHAARAAAGGSGRASALISSATRPAAGSSSRRSLRPHRQRARDLEQPAMPIGERVRRRVLVAGEPDEGDQVARDRRCVVGAAMAGAADHDVLEHRHVAEQLDGLERAHDALRARRRPSTGDAAGLPIDENCAGVDGIESGDHVDERGLARAVRADQGMDGAGLDAQAHIAQRLQSAEALADVAQLQRCTRAAGASSLRAGCLARRGRRPAAGAGRPAASRPITPLGRK